jgi:hypothetical protein
MRKNKSIAGFDDVANDNNNENVNNNDNKNDIINDILGDRKEKAVLTGIYFEPNVAAALDRATKDKKGNKSKLVNALVKKSLQDAGFL